jgi:hypothetical protein
MVRMGKQQNSRRKSKDASNRYKESVNNFNAEKEERL